MLGGRGAHICDGLLGLADAVGGFLFLELLEFLFYLFYLGDYFAVVATGAFLFGLFILAGFVMLCLSSRSAHHLFGKLSTLLANFVAFLG